MRRLTSLPRHLCWLICMFISYQMMALEAPSDHAEIDTLFHRWESSLPAPVSYEDNGLCSASKCPNHPVYSASFLTISMANRVPVRQDSDLTALLKWAKHSDACIRAIALGVIVKRIGFDQNEFVIGMEDPECKAYHHIMVLLTQYLHNKKVNYDNALFDGMFVIVKPNDVSALVSGKWEEVVTADSRLREQLTFDEPNFLLETLTSSNGQWLSEHQLKSKVEAVEITNEQQLLITFSHYVSPGKKMTFLLWPLSQDIMWLRHSTKFGAWKKFHRAK